MNNAAFAVCEAAPAKINLALHVTGRRPDGYHLLESLVVFTAFGDEVAVSNADQDRFCVDGPFASDIPADGDNLVLKARDALRASLTSPLRGGRCAIHLAKNLPVASGIGGGSSDAAAALRALDRLWNARLSEAQLASIALPLGADLPMCLAAKPLIARGVGEQIERISLPEIPIVLVNPGVAVSTPAVFKALNLSPLSKGGAGSEADRHGRNLREGLPGFPSGVELETLLKWLSATRNDLQAPSISIAPPIATALAALEAQNAAFIRMSGSGATCFGLFSRTADAMRAAMAIRAAEPSWFAVATHTME